MAEEITVTFHIMPWDKTIRARFPDPEFEDWDDFLDWLPAFVMAAVEESRNRDVPDVVRELARHRKMQADA